MLYESLGNENRALQIHIQNRVVILLGDIPEIRAPFQPGVVHQNVDAAELLHRVADEALSIRNFAHVALKRRGLSPAFLNCRHDFVGTRLIRAEAQRDVRAFRSETFHNGPADALVTAGNRGYFAFQSGCHQVSLISLTDEMRWAGSWICRPSACWRNGKLESEPSKVLAETRWPPTELPSERIMASRVDGHASSMAYSALPLVVKRKSCAVYAVVSVSWKEPPATLVGPSPQILHGRVA